MAYRRFPLPALKLTQRPAFGQKSEKVIQRGVSDSQPVSSYNEPKEYPDESPENSSRFASPFAMLQPITELKEPTDYELESKASVAGWERVRNGMLRAVTEAACLPLAQSCISCEKAASLRCQQCGPLAYFCPDCFDQYHHKVNIFHVAEKWEVSETVSKKNVLSVCCFHSIFGCCLQKYT